MFASEFAMREFSIPFDDETIVGIRLLIEKAPEFLSKSIAMIDSSDFKEPTRLTIQKELSLATSNEYAKELMSFANGMRQNIENYDFTIDEVLQAVHNGIIGHLGERNKLSIEYYNHKNNLKALLSSKNIIYISKISNLMRNNSKHLHNIQIVTNIIPVFDQDRSIVVGNIIKNILYLTTSDRNENEELIEIPLGIEDLKRLLSQAEFGIRKTEALEKTVKSQNLHSSIYRSHP